MKGGSRVGDEERDGVGRDTVRLRKARVVIAYIEEGRESQVSHDVRGN